MAHTRQHKFGFKALFSNYGKDLFNRGLILPSILTTIIIPIVYCYSEQPIIVILSEITDLIIALIPSLLGFVLSGYALLIGFGSIITIDKGKEPTLYQKISAVFSMSLIFQIGLLVVAAIIKLVLKVGISSTSIHLSCAVNYILTTFLFFCFLYILGMIKDLVINIFNYSQYQHYKNHNVKQ